MKAFVGAWVSQLHAKGYTAGVYANSLPVQQNISQVSPLPDAVWIAKYDGRATTWGLGSLSDSLWPTHQRSHQYYGGTPDANGCYCGFDATFGNVTGKIDLDINDAPVAGGNGIKTYSSYTGNALTDGGVPASSFYAINNAYMGNPDVLAEIAGMACSSAGVQCTSLPFSGGEYGLYWDVSAGFSVFSPEPHVGFFGLNNKPLAVGSMYTSPFRPSVEQGILVDPLSGITTTINFPPGPADGVYTWPDGINDAGQVVGRYFDGSVDGGFFLDATGVFSALSTGRSSVGINGVGQIVGNFIDSHGNEQGFVYSKADGYANIGRSNPLSITNNGQVLCGGGSWGFVYLYDIAHGTTQEIPCSGTCPEPPEGVNDSGVVVGGCVVSGSGSGCYATPNP